MLDQAHPKREDTLDLPLMSDYPTDPVAKKDKELAWPEVAV
jgi:hypothetical protein